MDGLRRGAVAAAAAAGVAVCFAGCAEDGKCVVDGGAALDILWMTMGWEGRVPRCTNYYGSLGEWAQRESEREVWLYEQKERGMTS